MKIVRLRRRDGVVQRYRLRKNWFFAPTKPGTKWYNATVTGPTQAFLNKQEGDAFKWNVDDSSAKTAFDLPSKTLDDIYPERSEPKLFPEGFSLKEPEPEAKVETYTYKTPISKRTIRRRMRNFLPNLGGMRQ